MVALDAQNNLLLRGQPNQRNFGRIDDPKVGLLFAQPVKKQRCASLPGDLARIQRRGLERDFAYGPAQALRQRPSAALVGRGKSFIAPAFLHQQVDVIVVGGVGVGGEGQPRVFVLELRPRRLEGGQRGFVDPLRFLLVALPLK